MRGGGQGWRPRPGALRQCAERLRGSGFAIGPAGVPGRPGLWAGVDAKSCRWGDLRAGSQGKGIGCALRSLPRDTHHATRHLLLAVGTEQVRAGPPDPLCPHGSLDP